MASPLLPKASSSSNFFTIIYPGKSRIATLIFLFSLLIGPIYPAFSAAITSSSGKSPGIETALDDARTQKRSKRMQKRLEFFERQIVRRAERLMQSGNGSGLALLAGIFGVLALSFFQSGKEKHTKTRKKRKARSNRGDSGKLLSRLTFFFGVGGLVSLVIALVILLGSTALVLSVIGFVLSICAFVFGLIVLLGDSGNSNRVLTWIGFIPAALVVLLILIAMLFV